jgi:sigma-B regulation protein RsbU (phosphoserine phosphatase)
MLALDPQLTAGDILQAFHHDEPYLFMGSAFLTVGVVSIALSVLRRRFDALLIWLGIFAGLYGARLWLRSEMLYIEFHGFVLFDRLRYAIDFLIPLPAFYFFRVAGFLNRGGRWIVVATALAFSSMFAVTFALGPIKLVNDFNNLLVTVVLAILLLRSLRRKSVDRDFKVVRIGMLCFAALALWANLGVKLAPFNLEPYGFAVLLACLGYVAARRSFTRDVDLAEIHKELELARRMQLSILPSAFPSSASFKVAAKYVPMTSVAGDMYDFLLADDNHAGLLIADVSGHGIPAALIASMVKMAAISHRAQATHPAALLAGMNSALCGNTQDQYVTAAYVYLDARAREMQYSAAGHPAMLLLRSGAVSEISENGMLLAAVEDANYENKLLPLESGDRLLLYTDGLVEARNADGKLFGDQSLASELKASAQMTPSEAVDHLIDAVQRWARSQDDDLTVLVCDFVGDAAPAAAD